MVTLHHFSLAFYPALYFQQQGQTHNATGKFELLLGSTPLNFIFNGPFAVCIFFVLSGYVLSYSLIKVRHQNIRTLIAWGIRRYLRLIIPIAFSVFVSALLIYFHLFFNREASIFTKSYNWLDEFWDFDISIFSVFYAAFIKAIIFGDSRFNNVLWSMSHELRGSFLVAALLAFTTRINKKIIVYLLVFLSFAVYQKYFMICFLCGLMLCEFQEEINHFKFANNKLTKMVVLVLVLIYGSFPENLLPGSLYNYVFVFSIHDPTFYYTIASVLLLLLINHSVKLSMIFSNKVLVFLGQISFALYLLHCLLLGSLSCYLFLFLYENLAFDYQISTLITLCVSLPILILLSYLMTISIDNWAIVYSKKIYRLLITEKVERQPDA